MSNIKFEHPQHGTYNEPAEVAADSKLSGEEKKKLLTEWKQSLDHILNSDPHAEGAKDTHTKIETALKTL